MTFLQADPFELLGNLFAVIFTILVLLYAFGDSPAFRLVIHIFIGVSAGYMGGVVWHDVLRPQLIDPLLGRGAIPVSPLDLSLRLLLVGLLLTKISPRTAVVGNPATAYLVAIGAATAVGGAIQGTIFPLASSSGGLVSTDTIQLLLWDNISNSFLVVVRFLLMSVVLFGTIATLGYFYFSAKSLPNQTPVQNRAIIITAWVGQIFIAITFGTLFAGVYIASLDALIERLFFLWSIISSFVFG